MTFGDFQTQALQNAERPNEKWIYRGHANSAWSLVTTYSRFHANVFGGEGPYTLKPFRSMLEQFIRRASETAGIDYGSYSVFQKLALAQHYGVPTPMLDWTHSPYVATYFAVTDPAGYKEADIAFCIHAMEVNSVVHCAEASLDESELLEDTGQRFGFLDTKTFFSRRIARQAGCFTYHKFRECLTSYATPGSAPRLKKYMVSGSRSKITRELTLMGITGGVLFDDLDYIAKDVVQSETMAILET